MTAVELGDVAEIAAALRESAHDTIETAAAVDKPGYLHDATRFADGVLTGVRLFEQLLVDRACRRTPS